MADNTKPIPPVPNKSDLLEPGDKNKKMSATWIRWMIQLRDKINLINATIASLSGFSGSGFISADGAGEVNGRTIQGTTGNISVTNGDGVSGNPVVNLVDTAVTPGTYANTNLTVDEFGRITNATNGSASGAPLTTKGDLFGYDTGDARIPVGTDGYVLTADSSSPTGLSYQAPGTPTLPVTTKGDLLGFSTVPARLPVGTDGQIIRADSSDPLGIKWTDASIPTLVASATVSGSASTTISIPSITIDKTKKYRIYITSKNVVGSTINISIYFNGDTTASNYNSEILLISGSTVTGAAISDSLITSISASSNACIISDMVFDIDTKPRLLSNTSRDAGSSIKLYNSTTFWNSASAITSVLVQSSVASSLAIGSKIEIFELF